MGFGDTFQMSTGGRRGFERRHNKVVSRHLPHLIVCKVVTIINMLLIIITAITTIITIILVIMRASKSIISVDLISVNKQVFSFKFGQNFSFHTVRCIMRIGVLRNS